MQDDYITVADGKQKGESNDSPFCVLPKRRLVSCVIQDSQDVVEEQHDIGE